MLARNMTFAAMLAAAFAVRLAFSVSGLAFQIDMNTFMAWSERVVNVGMREFYSPYIFTDYPPGYMYVLFILGRLRALLDLSFGSAAHTVLMMMPAILADLTTGAVLYRLALQQLPRHNAALLAAAYLFNPVIILNSAVWGQVDSVFVLPILLSLVGLTRRNYLAAYLLYAAAILIKPQALIFAPVYLFSFLIVLQDHGVKDGLAKLVRWGAACAALAVAVMLPFSQGFNILPILAQYIDTMTHYAWASVNAYNFHALAGAVWRPQDTLFLGFVPHFVIGHASIVAVTLLSLYLLWRDHIAVPIFNRNSYNPANIFFTAALLCAVVFVFSVRMHERYLYPAIPLLMLVYMFRPDKRILVLLAGFTLTNTVNVIDALNMLNAGVDTSLLVNLRWASGLNIVLAVTMVYLAFNLFGANYAAPYPAKAAAKPAANLLPFEKKLSAYSGRLSACIEKYEWRMLAGLVIVYAVIAFSRLGDFHAPQSFWDMRQHREESDWFTGWTPREPEDVAFNLGEYTFINRLLVYLGPRHNQEFSIFISGADRQWHHYRDFNLHSVFAWHDFGVNIHAHYIFVRPASTGLIIGEMGFKHNDRLITPPGMSHHPLFDEQHLVPPHPHFMNSTYFDEIYHPRTAYEFIHGMFVFENTHPPLGKVIKSWGIRAFGMTPFGWRFSGTFVGVLMLIPMYFLARELFGSKPPGFVAAGLFAFDFMHFAQTRLATIDTYVTFFVILMYLFMYMYYRDDPRGGGSFRKDMLWLFLCGLSTGLAIASKWQGVYAVAGLALLWLMVMVRRQWRDARAVIPLCVIFFIAVPAAVYVLSYMPYISTPWTDGFSAIIANQTHMFTYHAGIDQPHPFSARWWQWPINTRPMFMYLRVVTPYTTEGISSFGSPLVWWGGLAGMAYAVYRSLDTTRPRGAALFIVIGYASQFVPWMFVSRTTYIYHYFPSVPFITLALVYAVKETIDGRRPYVKYAALSLGVLLFVMFYPVLSGLAVPNWYVDTFLRWVGTWRLI